MPKPCGGENEGVDYPEDGVTTWNALQVSDQNENRVTTDLCDWLFLQSDYGPLDDRTWPQKLSDVPVDLSLANWPRGVAGLKEMISVTILHEVCQSSSQ